jgi:hypothetical protein
MLHVMILSRNRKIKPYLHYSIVVCKKQELFSEGAFEKAEAFVGDAGLGSVFCGGLFEKSPPHPPKTPPNKIVIPT